MYPEMLGRRAVEAALKAARGEPIEKRIDVGESLVTKENAAQFLRSLDSLQCVAEPWALRPAATQRVPPHVCANPTAIVL
jgi:hypothetical protein